MWCRYTTSGDFDKTCVGHMSRQGYYREGNVFTCKMSRASLWRRFKSPARKTINREGWNNNNKKLTTRSGEGDRIQRKCSSDEWLLMLGWTEEYGEHYRSIWNCRLTVREIYTNYAFIHSAIDKQWTPKNKRASQVVLIQWNEESKRALNASWLT